MAGWENEEPNDDYNWGAPGPATDFAALTEQNGFGGDDSGHPRDDICRNCGHSGHFARECPEPRQGGSGACFNCGEEGHNKVDCPHPRVFQGTCRVCNEEGHPASECPQKPADICKNCRGEGHKTSECNENRKFDLNDVADETPQDAWDKLKKADTERDLDDFRDSFQVYAKAEPTKTFVDIEKQLRVEGGNVHLIALEKQKEGFENYTFIDLQGKLNCTYVVKFFFDNKPHRDHLVKRWPTSPEDNLERLTDAGFEYDRLIPKCVNCGELGHIAKSCKQERTMIERVEIKCVNCSEVGHRARDCTKQREQRDKFACRNCGSPDHKAVDCTEPPNLDHIECRRCNQNGHFAKDCPNAPKFARACRKCGAEDHLSRDCGQQQNMDLITCNNCDETGHYARDCPKPRDWSRVKCSNCGEMGHTNRRCS
ncbi:hypothetical protein EYB26_004111 [Talaromyces marneffei]|uniref:uncharacterized protein n=1 Tax=Talaromyces marneffei TaxID=37727 RepID=UPI0012A91B70|nr:uncharacterized protein EYB26_004111 [Talaromyces marneffei]QGA16444.1 hypothetical protein EYB26_004111 [Talaromyces marneffei]